MMDGKEVKWDPTYILESVPDRKMAAQNRVLTQSFIRELNSIIFFVPKTLFIALHVTNGRQTSFNDIHSVG